jgi:hypothetical protein
LVAGSLFAVGSFMQLRAAVRDFNPFSPRYNQLLAEFTSDIQHSGMPGRPEY